MFHDAHNHLQDAWLTPHRAQMFIDLAQIPVRSAVVNGTAENDWPEVSAFCSSRSLHSSLHPQLLLRPSYGLHPWQVGNASSHWRDTLRRHLDAEPQAVIGEIGLDRWIIEGARPDDSRLVGLQRASLDEQRAAFVWQLTLAAERNLPVTIHCIDAWGALLDVLRATPRPARGFLLHAYAGSAELAREFATLGAYFSFNGNFLAPGAGAGARAPDRSAPRREVFRLLRADRVLVETDAPAMPPPANHRPYSLPGLANGTSLHHPANIAAAYAGLATLRSEPIEALAAQVERNFFALFGATPA